MEEQLFLKILSKMNINTEENLTELTEMVNQRKEEMNNLNKESDYVFKYLAPPDHTLVSTTTRFGSSLSHNKPRDTNHSKKQKKNRVKAKNGRKANRTNRKK